MTPDQSNPELQQLLAQLLDDELAASDRERLAELLEADDSARELYYELMQTHSMLLWEKRAPRDLDLSRSLGVASIGVDEEDEVVSLPARLNHWMTDTFPWLATPLSLALLVASLVTTIIVLSLALWIVPVWKPAVVAPVDWSTEYVARITDSYQPRFAEREVYRDGQSLFGEQRIDLQSGLLELTFTSGTRVVLNGPCQVVLAEANAAALESGGLTATVPPEASGFTVRTSHANVIDLGTEFGVATDENDSSIEVFDGSVRVERNSASLTVRKSFQVNAGEAYVIDSTGVARRQGVGTTQLVRGSQFPRAIEVASYSLDAQLLKADGETYRWPDSEGRELSNSKIGKADFRDPEWVGFPNARHDLIDPQPLVTFDLGTAHRVREVACIYLHSAGVPNQLAGGSVTAPEEVWISTSDDGQTFTEPRKYTPFDASPGTAVRYTPIPLEDTECRYVRLDFRQTSQWTFLTEVMFLGSPVTAPVNP